LTIVQSADNDPYNRTQAPSSGQVSGQGSTLTPNTLSNGAIAASTPREGFLTGSFVWMFVGVMLSAAAAWFVMVTPTLQEQVADMYFFLLIGVVVLGIGINMVINRISPVVALGLFFVYALAWGLMLGLIVPAYVGSAGMSGVVSAFLGAAAVFAGAAVYGVVTKRDLTSITGLLFMGMLGLIVMMFAQIFFFADSSLMSIGIGIAGVVLFTGVTAYDVQRLKDGRMPGVNKDSATVQGALALYVDFLMLFMMMLRIFGGSR
jgi:FtsH-binding integral membrane protein